MEKAQDEKAGLIAHPTRAVATTPRPWPGTGPHSYGNWLLPRMATVFANVSLAAFIPEHEWSGIFAIVDSKAHFFRPFRTSDRQHLFRLFDRLFNFLAAFGRDFRRGFFQLADRSMHQLLRIDEFIIAHHSSVVCWSRLTESAPRIFCGSLSRLSRVAPNPAGRPQPDCRPAGAESLRL